MALTPEGTPYVESTDLVANYPAASLSLANRVDLVGVLPFADAAARTAAIPTPTDGQFTYLQDTNTPEFYDGSNFVPVGTAPGLVHINTTTFSAVSSVSVDDVFTSDYDNYVLKISGTNSAANPSLNVRLRVSGSDATGSNYDYTYGIQYSQFLVTDYGFDINQGLLLRIAAEGLTFAGKSEISNPALAAPTHFNSVGSTTQLDTYGLASVTQIVHKVSTSYDGLTLFPSAGTITGTLRIYGYKNS